MRIVALSDVHGRFGLFSPRLMPAADLCIIAGDITTRGLWDTREFMQSEAWLESLLAHYRVFWIPGNHDLLMPPDVYHPLDERGLTCILNTSAEFGGYSFAGVSMSPCYDMPELASQWCNMTCRREVEEAAYAQIPPWIDVVISHCPPLGIMDAAGYVLGDDGTWAKRSIGSVALRRYIERHQPKMVICGHVHGAAGHVRCAATDVYNVAECWRVIELPGKDASWPTETENWTVPYS